MHVALLSGTVVRTADGDFTIEALPVGSVLLDGSIVQAITPSLTGRDIVMFTPGSLDGAYRPELLYLPTESVVRRWDAAAISPTAKWFAAGGAANGDTVRITKAPRRLRCFTVKTNAQWLRLAQGVDVATCIMPAGAGCVATVAGQGDIAPARRMTRFPEAEAIPLDQRQLPVLLAADGQWAALIARERVGDDLLFHFRVHAASEHLQVMSMAYLPIGSQDRGPTARRFGVAILEIAVDGVPLPLDGTAFLAGFYETEGETPRRWRWTNGAGSLVIPMGEQARMVTVRLTDWHELLRDQPE